MAYGNIPGYPAGSTFATRREVFDAGLHGQTRAGIWPWGDGAAESIVVSGGYEDDEDYGDLIIYTGHGGREAGKQVADQEFVRGNAALARSNLQGIPVRVIRGADRMNSWSPPNGYRYEGLFRVTKYWREQGKSGHRVCRFRLVEATQPSTIEGRTASDPSDRDVGPTRRVERTAQQLVRSAEVAEGVKKNHEYRCQVCGFRLDTPLGPYAEGAHIRPLGRPHDGPDVASNVLCLCPNDHVRFDSGAIIVDANGGVFDRMTRTVSGELRRVSNHRPEWAHFAYHRAMFED